MKLSLAYLAVVFIWATTPLAIQWSGQDHWFVGVAGRIFISALLVIPIVVWVSRQPFQWHRAAFKVYFAAALGMLGGMTPMYYAAQTMPSGWISLIFGLTPMFIGLLASFLLAHTRIYPTQWLGIGVSLVGLSVVLAPQWRTLSSAQWDASMLGPGVMLAILAAFSHSLSTVWVKRFNQAVQLPHTHIVAAAVWLTSGVYLAVHPEVISAFETLSAQSMGAILYLGVFGSLFGFMLYYYVLNHVAAVKIGLIPLITPLMALALGATWNHEPLNHWVILGAGLVLTGLVVFEYGHRVPSAKMLRLISQRLF